MPNPTAGDVHVNGLLTDMSVAYVQDATKFVASRAFPVKNVTKKSDIYAVYDRGDFLRDEAELRAPGSESAGGGYRVDTSNTYSVSEYAFHVDVADQVRANADQPFQPDADASVFLAQKVLLKEEIQFGTDFFTTSVWTGSSSGSDLVAGTDFTAWDDPTSTPIDNITDEMAEVESDTGLLPNKLVLNRRAFTALMNHPDFVDRVKHTSDTAVSAGIIANLLGLDEILVAAGIRNTADEGATAVTDYIFGNHALLLHAAAPGLYTPTAGSTFRWTAAGSNAQTVSTFRMEHLKSDRHEIEFNFDHVAIAPLLGVFFQNVVS